MTQFSNRIKQLSEFVLHFTNMDTVFIDEQANVQIEFLLTKTPDSLNPYFADSIKILKLHDTDSENDILLHSNSYRLNFISAKVFTENQYLGSILVGPYLLHEPTIHMIESIISDNKMAISLKNLMKQYYLSLPLIDTYEANIIAEFLSYLTSNFDTYSASKNVGKLNYKAQTKLSTSAKFIKENTVATMAAVEERYKTENEMLHAVETGNLELFEKILSQNNSLMSDIPDRVPNDPLRSGKNNTFVLNTLLRKAAEKGGVHPIYLDSLSSKYAIQIEQCASQKDLLYLSKSIVIDYCDAVRKLSLKSYSLPIRKAIDFIRLNLNYELSLEVISSELHISSYELSRQFKRETGNTLTEYINNRRINEATYLLENKQIPITDIALMVGYNDVNYFTKVFKKIKGLTPSKFRSNKV